MKDKIMVLFCIMFQNFYKFLTVDQRHIVKVMEKYCLENESTWSSKILFCINFLKCACIFFNLLIQISNYMRKIRLNSNFTNNMNSCEKCLFKLIVTHF